MTIRVVVRLERDEPAPVGATLRVEVRDVSYADAAATVVGWAVGAVAAPSDDPALLAEVSVDVERVPAMATIWVHVDVDGDGRVSAGDFITKQSYPIPAEAAGSVTVAVLRV